MKYNDNYNTLKNNQYYLDNYGIRCAFKLHKNNDTALANFPYVKTKEYSNEGIGIIFYLKRKSNIVVFHPYYKHIQTKKIGFQWRCAWQMMESLQLYIH